jgi:hypothetical protein
MIVDLWGGRGIGVGRERGSVASEYLGGSGGGRDYVGDSSGRE